MYTAYVLTKESRDLLTKHFPPMFPDFIGHHITVKFGVPKNTPAPEEPSNVKVIAHCVDRDGIEALVVMIDGTVKRDDGNYFHITWSLDRSKGYKPVMSNDLVKARMNDSTFNLIKPIPIDVVSKVLK